VGIRRKSWVEKAIAEFLKSRTKEGILRVLNPADTRKEGNIFFDNKEYVDFSSNDYLGLSSHPALKAAAQTAMDKFGTGSCASRLLSGDLKIHHELEEKTALFKQKEAALVFNTGYQANTGIISSLFKKTDCIFLDKLSHASIIDGVLLSGARFFRFNHNDTDHLEVLLTKERKKFKNSLIISETVFSMDGDFAPLKDLARLKRKYDCKILVDEAHATGIFGKNGSGMAEAEGLTQEMDLIMGTFSKALGSFGAYIVCSQKIKDYLINSCRSFIYSTSLPPAVIAANIASLEIIKKEPIRRKTLLENARYFRDELKKQQLPVLGSSQIVPLVTGSTEKTLSLSKVLRERGFYILPIRPPTVAAGSARLRFSLTYHHTKDMLKKVAQCLNI